MELQFSCRHAEHDQDSFSGIVVLFHLPLYAVPVLFCSLVELFYGSFQSHGKTLVCFLRICQLLLSCTNLRIQRTWKRAPMLGNTISRFSRKYFFSTALVAMAIISSYYWSGFPYDNLVSKYFKSLLCRCH